MLPLLLALTLPAAPDITVTFNGRPLTTTAPPVEKSGRVLVAMRDIFEAMNAELKWNAASRTVTATQGSTRIALTVGSATASVGGRTVPLDVPAQIIDNYTYVPLRFVAESTSAKVQWVAATRTVVVTAGSGGGIPPQSSTLGDVQPPVITSPRSGDRVGPAVEVAGRTTPGSAIRIVTYVYTRANGTLVSQVPGILHDVGANGEFSHRIALPANRTYGPPDLYYDIHCWTVLGGEQSRATIVRVYRR
jgi:hypothetical protein